MSALEMVINERWVPGERHHLLGDPVAGISSDVGPTLFELFVRCARTDRDSIAPCLGNRFDDESIEIRKHELTLFLLPEQIRVDVRKDGRLSEVVLDHLRHVGVDGLVVGNPITDSIGDRDVAGTGRRHQTGHAER